MKATVVGGGGFVLFLLMQLAGLSWFAFTVVLPLTLLVAVIISVRIGGRSVAQSVEMIAQDYRRRCGCQHLYLSGFHSRIPGGHRRLPGLLARTELLAGVDALGRVFAVIFDKPRREATVLFDCQFSGQTAMTQRHRNMQTANWGRWLAGLSLAGDVVSAAVVIATRPGTGGLVSKEVAATLKDEAPWIARQIQLEAAEHLSCGIPEIEAHIALTFKVSIQNADDTNFLELLGMRLSNLYEDLSWAGIQAAPMTEGQTVAKAHQFYNPASEADFEELRVHGLEHALSWADAGPSVAVTKPDSYLHNGVVSATWEMAAAPRSTFEDTLLSGLIAPHSRIERKRVCLVYRPFEAGSGASRVEAEHTDALVAANASKKTRAAAAELRLEHTEAARRAQARGAQLGRYSLFVTATTTDPDQMRQIRHDIEQLGAQSNLRLRLMRRQQDAAFAVSCGLGQIPWSKPSTSAITAG